MLVPVEIPPGLIGDDTTFSTPSVWEDGSNVRFWRGKPEVIGGWTRFIDGIDGKCRGLMNWTNNGGDQLVAIGTNTKLYVAWGGMLYDITDAGLAAGAADGALSPGYGSGEYGEEEYGDIRSNFYPRTWSLDTYGESLMANPRGETIYWWQNVAATPSAELTNAPASVTSMVVSAERQVIAFGCNEVSSGTFNPLCIRGSDIENVTDWTPGASDNSFEDILEGGGRIVTARKFGPYIAVWTDNSVYLGQFLGQLGQTYRWDRIAQNHGLIGPNAVAIVGQTAFWIGPDFQFRAWSVGGVPEIIPCPIRNDFADNLSEAQGDKIYGSSVTKFSEVWFHYPDARDGNENSRYVALNVADGTWFRGIMGRTAFIDAGVTGFPIATNASGQAHYHEYGRNANGANLDWFLKSADQYLDEGGRHMMIRGIRPDFEDQQGAISLTLSLRKYPQAEAVAKGPFILAEGAGKKDFRASGAVVALTFSGASNPSFMRLGKPVFDAVPTGER